MGQAGLLEEQNLQKAGFAPEEIAQWKVQTKNDLANAGFSSAEIDDHFGVKTPDMTPTKKMFQDNFAKAQEAEAGKEPAKPSLDLKTVELAPTDSMEHFKENTIKAIEAGYGMSVTSLLKSAPSTVLPEQAPMFYRIASQVSQLAGDVPAMIAGSAMGTPGGAYIGSKLPGPKVLMTGAGAVAGGGYGAFALPAAVRKVMMDHYEKGDVQSFSDFWERSAATFIDANKEGVIGMATVGVGGAVGKIATKVGAPAVVKTSAQLMSEVGTMTTLGSAMEGKMPEPQDFLEAGIVVAALHGSTSAAKKLRSTFAQGGILPAEVATQAKTDPLIKQDLLVEGPPNEVPENIARANGIPKSIDGKSMEIIPEVSETRKIIKRIFDTEPPVRTEAEQKILSQIGEKQEVKKDKYTLEHGYKDFVDKLDPLKGIMDKLEVDPNSLKADENPFILGRLANDFTAKVKHFIEKGTFNFADLKDNGGESFKSILKPFAKDPAGFDIYLAAKRSVEVEGRGLKSGFDMEAAKDVIKNGDAKYADAAKRLTAFQNNILNYAKDSGMISAEQYKAMVEANKSYVPFHRLIEVEPGTGKSGKANSLKEFKGSEAKIQSPLMSILENTKTLTKLAEINRSKVAAIKLAESIEGQTLFEKVKAEAVATEVSEREVAKFMADHGIEGKTAEAFTVFRHQQKAQLAPNEFAVYRDGKREVWKTEPIIAEAMKALDGDANAQNFAIQVASAFTSIKKIAITATPDFILANLFRDQITKGILTKGGGTVPFSGMISAIGDLIKKNDSYYNWLKSGGAQGTFIDLGDKYINKEVFKIHQETGFMDQAWNVLKSPVDFLQAAGMLAEHATRLAEFKQTVGSETSGTKIFEGGYNAREVTVDFSRMGAKMAAMNSITAFQNMAIQGTDRVIRGAKENPKEFATRVGVYIVAPSILLWYANKDDERVKNLPDWQKHFFWIVTTDNWEKPEQGISADVPKYLQRNNPKTGELEINNGHIFRIPKPQELGLIFGTGVELILEKFFTANPEAFKNFGNSIEQKFVPGTTPDVIAPIREQWANKSLFTGNKIVNGSLEGVAPAYQYNEYTTETAKQLGKMIRFIPGTSDGKLPYSSPMVIENYVRSWTGNSGMYVLQMAEKALVASGAVPDPIRPDDTLSDIPFIKSFAIRYPGAGAQPIQDFYNNYEKHAQTLNTLNMLKTSGQVGELEKYISDPKVIENLDNLKGIKEGLTRMSHLARLIYNNRDMDKSDKRQQLDGVYYMMIDTAKIGNEITRELDKGRMK